MQNLTKTVFICKKSLSHIYFSPVGVEALSATHVNLQSVRWRKKRWDPPAKTKTFQFPIHKRLPPGENDEIIRLVTNYKTHYKSVKAFLVERHEQLSDTSEAAQREADEEARHHAEMMALNRRENERIAQIREERVKRELDDKLEEVTISKLKNEEKDLKMREEALVRLKETEEFANTFIPPEEFLTVLSNAYDNPTDYNFAIDTEGNVYPGRGTKPWEIAKEDLKKLPAVLEQ